MHFSNDDFVGGTARMTLSKKEIARIRKEIWEGDIAYNTPNKKYVPAAKINRRCKPKMTEAVMPRQVAIDRIKYLHLQGRTLEQIAAIVGGFSIDEIKGFVC